MSQTLFQLLLVLATVILFCLAFALNEWLLRPLEYTPGINWIYLPAGMRLLCTLLFGSAGAIGLLIASWLVSFYLFPDDVLRAAVGGIIATIAPYLVYRIARRVYGLEGSLVNLTPARLLACILAYSFMSPLLHHIWFALRGDSVNLVSGFFAMFIGDLVGTLIVVYAMKGALAAVRR